MATNSNRNVAQFKGIVQLPLTEAHVGHVQQLEQDMTECIIQMENMLQEGYTFGFEYDSTRSQYTCKVFGMKLDNPNAGYQFYANAPTWEGALAVAVVKHFFVAMGGKWGEVQSTQVARYS